MTMTDTTPTAAALFTLAITDRAALEAALAPLGEWRRNPIPENWPSAGDMPLLSWGDAADLLLATPSNLLLAHKAITVAERAELDAHTINGLEDLATDPHEGAYLTPVAVAILASAVAQ